MLETRNVSFIDKDYFKSGEMVELCMRINKPGKIPEIVDKLSKVVLGFHISTDYERYFYKKREVNPVMIPNFEKLDDAALYMFDHHTPNFNDSMATIGVNSDTVVLNISHVIADGGYFQKLLDLISHPEKPLPEVPHLPLGIFENFEKQLYSKDTEQCPFLYTEPDVTRVKTKQNVRKEDVLPDGAHYHITVPVEDLSIYNKDTKKVKGLTEAFWTSLILTASAINDNIEKRCGSMTALNMRQFLSPEKRDQWNIGNHYSNLTPCCDLDESITIRELGRRMRENFNYKLSKGMQYSFFTATPPPGFVPPQNKIVEISNVGPSKIADPIEDVYMKFTFKDTTSMGLITHTNFAVVGHGKNVLHGNICYQSSTFEHKNARIFANDVEFALRNLPLDMTVGKAVEIIQQNHKTYKL